MSTPAAEPAAPAPRAGGSGIFTNRIGPLPMWGWVAIAAGILLTWRVFSSRQEVKSAASETAPDTTSAAEVPQFVNQTYTTVTPPPAPDVTVSVGPLKTAHPSSPRPPATVSGAPGSFTTGLQGGKMNEWTSTGKYSLNVVAKSHGMTAQQLIHASLASEHNVGLQNYLKQKNYNLKVPAGVHLYIPAQFWRMKK